jgi:hypothetical protein
LVLDRARGIPLIFRITPFSEPAGLDSTLERMGLPRFDTTAVESTRIDPARLPAASTEPLALADWVQAARRLYAHCGCTERYRYWYRGHSD